MSADRTGDSHDAFALPDATHDSPPRDVALEHQSDSNVNDAPSVAIVARASNASQSVGLATSTTVLGSVLAHDAIIVAFNINADVELLRVTDTLGNTYAPVVGPSDVNGSASYLVLASDIAAGSDTVTVMLTGASTGDFEVFVQEYSGLALTNTFDKGSWSSGTSMAIDGMVSGFVTTTFPHELIFAYGLDGTGEAGTGFTQLNLFEGDLIEGRVVTSLGMYEATATQVSGGDTWMLMMGTFRGQ